MQKNQRKQKNPWVEPILNKFWNFWGYESAGDYISRRIVEPQYKRLKKRELPEIIGIVNTQAEQRLPHLIDVGLSHLWNKSKPYALAAALGIGGTMAVPMIYNRIMNIGLPGIIRQLKQCEENAIPLQAKLNTILNRKQFSDSDTINLQSLKDIIGAYRVKLDQMVKAIDSALPPVTK